MLLISKKKGEIKDLVHARVVIKTSGQIDFSKEC